MQTLNFDEVLEKILERDSRYDRHAYFFVREALDHTQKNVIKNQRGQPHHVTGQELLQGIREHALNQYGPMTLTVLHEWGIQRGEDFGEIVFNMVEANLLAKTERDSREDFKNSYDFAEAFKDPFIPSQKRNASAPVLKKK